MRNDRINGSLAASISIERLEKYLADQDHVLDDALRPMLKPRSMLATDDSGSDGAESDDQSGDAAPEGLS